MKNFLLYTSIFISFLFIKISAQTSLYVLDPRQGWGWERGTIEEAVLSVKPHGLYLEYGLYLTFSARGTYFSPTDTLEVEMKFDLPDNAIVHDLWLWIGDSIMQANIIDRWTASSIYEDIVKRRRDPAILFKNKVWDYYNPEFTQYELRIFPMAAKETRKIKLTYLVPVDWNNNYITAALPMNILNSSNYSLSKLNLIYYPVTDFETPVIFEKPGLTFENGTDSTFGNYKKAEVSLSGENSLLNIGIEYTSDDGIFVSNYKNGDEGFYQLAVIPSLAFDLKNNKKIAAVIDYAANNAIITLNDLLNNLRNSLKANLTENDSFNVIYFKQLNVVRASEKWIPANLIDTVFNNITSVANYGSLPALLSNAYEFIDSTSNGSVLLVSNSTDAGNYPVANQLIKDLKTKMDPFPVTTVVDFYTGHQVWYYINNRYYYGNEYFFENITRLSGGNYYSLRNNNQNFSNIVSQAVQSTDGLISNFDLYTSTENGFCFGRYNISNSNEEIYLNKPILQIGKYYGEFPLTIQTSGIFDSEVFSKTIEKNSLISFPGNKSLETMWHGNFIDALENKEQTNSIVNEIIEKSIGNRILSLYTAFLALEPNDTISFCKDCYDEEDIIISVDEETEVSTNDTLNIAAFPNPFNSSTKIKVTLPADFDFANSSIKIYNILGEAVKTFDLNELGGKHKFEISWNGKSENGENVASGVYLFTIATSKKVQTLKLLLIK